MQPLTPGDPPVIGRYRVHGRIGAGGMGIVYAGSAPDGMPAAIKVVREQYAADAEFRSRFRREIAAMRLIRGRCVAAVLDWDTEGPQPWFAAEYIAGPTLSEYVTAHGPFPPGPLAALAAGTAEAIAAVHAAGVVHRDLKPSNVMLAADGPKVLDFGIARSADATALTSTGLTIGSPGWMSPEQLRGEPAGPATDVFAWGLLVGYAATGRSPFGTGAPEGVAYRILAEPPDLGGLAPDMAALVSAALLKDPAARPTAAQLLEGMPPVAGAPAPPTAPGHDPAAYVTGVLARHWNPEVAHTSPRPPLAELRAAAQAEHAAAHRRAVRRRAAVVAGAAAAVAAVLIAVNLPDKGSPSSSATGSGGPFATPTTAGAAAPTPPPSTAPAATPPGTTAPPSLTVPSSARPADLTKVDWRNRGYPDVCAFDPRPTTPIQVRGGTAPPSDGTGANTEIQDPVYGELSGRSVVVLPVLCTGLNHTPEYLVAYAAGPDGPQLLDFDLMSGGQRYIQRTRISGDTLTVTYVGHSPSQPLSSPDKTVTTTYRLRDNALVATGGDVDETVPPR